VSRCKSILGRHKIGRVEEEKVAYSLEAEKRTATLRKTKTDGIGINVLFYTDIATTKRKVSKRTGTGGAC